MLVPENLLMFSAVVGMPLNSHFSAAVPAEGTTMQNMTYIQNPDSPSMNATTNIILIRITSTFR